MSAEDMGAMRGGEGASTSKTGWGEERWREGETEN